MASTSNPATTVTVLAFTTRKPGLTADEFKSYYEDKHIPWVESLLLKADPPLSYTRSYVDRGADPGTAPNPSGTTRSFPMGGANEWDYDCIVRNVFRDEEHRDKCAKEYMKFEAEIGEDEARFMDRAKMKVMFVTEICGK